jgi:hypothetical protein
MPGRENGYGPQNVRSRDSGDLHPLLDQEFNKFWLESTEEWKGEEALVPNLSSRSKDHGTELFGTRLLGETIDQSPQAPKSDYFFRLMGIDPQTCDAIVGDLEEWFHTASQLRSPRAARLHFWLRAVHTALPLLRTWITNQLVSGFKRRT